MMKPQVSLKCFNTFSIDVYAYNVVQIYTENDLLNVCHKCIFESGEILSLGRGSNVLFLEDYNGTILLNRIKGIELSEDKNYWYLHVGSGELWHQLVIYSLEKNMPGLENLALIPGCVGAAPIQNIGAYSVEFQQFCEYVDIFNLDIPEKIRMTSDECRFDYRNSVFKYGINFNYAIVAVGLRLKKCWKPALNYDGLKQFNVCNVTPWEIFYAVCMMRKKKLPNPLFVGNAGSFFKNPIVKIESARALLKYYPNVPIYLHKNGLVKLSAKWLIDHCSLQKCKVGKASFYKNQSSVLINSDQQASPCDILELALYIHNAVEKCFHIFLEPEVQFINNFGKIDGIKLFSTDNSISCCNYGY